MLNVNRLCSTLLAASALTAAISLAPAPPARAQEPNPIPQVFHTIYPPAAQAQPQLQEAMRLAAQQHKRILVDFGNNKNPDCQVLSEYLHEEPNQAQIAEHFLLVNINVGPNLDQNRDLVQRFGVPLGQGIPALAVLDAQGHVLYAQTHGEFQNARNIGPRDVTEFLNKWRE